MATKKDTAPAPGPMALLEFGGTSIVLPIDAATQAFALLCQGEIVDYSWSDRVYRRVTDPARAPMLKTFSLTQYAQLALEDTAK